MCENSSILSMLLLVKNFLNLLTIIVPIVLILYTMLDLIKNQIDVDKKYLKVIGKRFIYAILIFLVPTIINLIVNNIDEEDKNNSSTPNINSGNTCIYFQGDYASHSYNSSCGSIASCGCGTTSTAVILCTMLKDPSYEPIRVTREVCKMGGCTAGGSSMNVLIKYLNSKGLKTEAHDTHYSLGNFSHAKAKTDIYNALKNNNMVLFHITRHFFVLSGLENDKIRIVQVGNKGQSQKTYTYEELKAMVESMTKNGKHRVIQGYVIVSK